MKKEKMGRDDEQLLVRELKAAYVKERTPRRAIEKLDKVRRVLAYTTDLMWRTLTRRVVVCRPTVARKQVRATTSAFSLITWR